MPSIWDDDEVQTPERSKDRKLDFRQFPMPSTTPAAKNSIWDMPACFNPCDPLYDQITAEYKRTARLKAKAAKQLLTKKWWQCKERRMTGVWLPKLKKRVSVAASSVSSSSSSALGGEKSNDVAITD